MPSIVFWNVRGRDLRPLLCQIAVATSADVMVLCEDDIDPKHTLASLRCVSPDFEIADTIERKNRFQCFCKSSSVVAEEVHKGFRTSVHRLKFANRVALLGLVHGVDIRNHDGASRQSVAQEMAGEFRFAIEQQKTQEMIILGDFNMNPYDQPMNLAMGMNAMMTKSCIIRGAREYQNKKYDFYYNPMWGLFGDNGRGPPGTVYDTSNQGPYGWNMVDQVLIHHAALSMFRSVHILTMAGATTLADRRGHPSSATASDHFPILVELQ